MNCEGWAGSSDCKQEVVIISGFELSENLKVLSQETSSEMHFLSGKTGAPGHLERGSLVVCGYRLEV